LPVLILLFAWIYTPVAGLDTPAAVDSLLKIAADSTKPFDTRLDAVREATRIDDTGRSDAAKVLLLIAHPSPENLVIAQTAAKRAINKDRKNADYIGLMARLMWRIGRRGTALEYAERAVKANSTNPIGHYWEGRYHFWETMKYLWMQRVEYNQDSRGFERPHTIDLGPWGEKAREKAESSFTHVLQCAPDHEAARRYLGLIYYQTRRAAELRELYKSMLRSRPEDPLPYFTVGLSYHLERDYERAYQAYNKGLHRMSTDEQRFMLAVFTDHSADPKLTIPDMQTLQRFWAGKNPLFLSPVNERMLEQCRRVAYANVRYGEQEKGIDGWSTDRGQAYIRFGDPLGLQSRPAEVDTHLDDPMFRQRWHNFDANLFGTFSDRYEFGKELWRYENLVLVFDNTDTRDAWKFRIAALDGAIIGLEDLVERVPERFVDPFGDRRFEISYQWAQFRDTGGKSRIELYYAIPANKVETQTAKGLGTVDFEKGLFVFNSAWDTLDVKRLPVKQLAWIKDRQFRDGYLLASEVLRLAPGKYNLAGEILDRKTEHVGGFRSRIPVRSFSKSELEISSILLARRVMEKPDRPFGRGRYVILPNPVRETERNRKAYFYFEVYNLASDDFGRTNYSVTYQTKPIATDPLGNEDEWITAVTSEVAGDHPWEPVYLALDVTNAQPGLRDFRVIIEDKLSGQTASESTQYRIRW